MLFRSNVLPAMVFVIGLPAGNAMAFEPTGDPVGDHIMKLFEAAGAKDVSYGGFSRDGNTFELTDIKGLVEEEGEELSLSIARMAVVNGTLPADGRMTADAITASGMSVKSDDFAMTVDALTSSGVRYPALEVITGKSGSFKAQGTYDSANLEKIAFSTKEGVYIPIEKLTATNSDYLGDVPRKANMTLDNLVVSTENLPSGEVSKGMSDLGYESVTVNVNIDWQWNDANGKMSLPEFGVRSESFGDLIIKLETGGWTPELVGELAALDPKDAESAQAMLGKLQGTTVDNISVEFINNSIVDRLLDNQSGKAGMDRADFVDRLAASLDGPLATLRNAAFQQMIKDQVTAFLKDPKTLTLAAAPANPVPIAQIIGMVAIAPQTIPDILGVSVVAGQ